MSTYTSPIISNRPPEVVDLAFYADIRYDVDDSAPIYIGMNVTNGSPTSGLDWKVLKFTYSGSNVIRIQVAYGAWDSRIALFS